MVKNQSMAIAIALACILILPGCIRNKPGKELTMMWWGDVYNARSAQKIADAYNATNPQFRVKVIAVPHVQYKPKMLTMAASRTLPDIVLMTTKDVQELGAKRALLPFVGSTRDSRLTAVEKEMWPGLLNTVKLNGKILAVPIWTWSPGVYYNKDMFDAAGVAYPSKDWDWNEFSQKVIKLTKKSSNGRTLVYGIQDLRPMFYTYLRGYGVNLYSKDFKKCLVTSPESIAVLKSYFDLKSKGITPLSTQRQESGNADIFRSGNAAMCWGGRDYIDVIKQEGGVKFRWGVVPIPRGKEKTYYQTAMNLAVGANTQFPDAAWNFLLFAISEKGQQAIALSRSDIPVLKKLVYSQEFLSYQDRPDANKMFREIIENSVPLAGTTGQTLPAFLPGMEKWETTTTDQFVLVELKQISLEEACARIAREYDSELQQQIGSSFLSK